MHHLANWGTILLHEHETSPGVRGIPSQPYPQYLSAGEKHREVEIVGACEEDSARVQELLKAGEVALTHDSIDNLMAQSGCDAVAVGDYFGRRGNIVLAALNAGKHVISDKPICTNLHKLEEIERLTKEKKLCIGCQFDLRGSGALRTMRRLIGEQAIGEILTITITAQHPLLLGSRPGWYFEPGKHGGTINDIGVHAMDVVPWLTGRQIVQVVAARQWNARLPQYPHFGDAAQFMLKLDNGGGLLADVSYLAPDACGYHVPQYWRITCHGDGGVIETQANATTVMLVRHTDKHPQQIPADADDYEVTLRNFLDEIAGKNMPGALTTEQVLLASKKALMVQQAADREATGWEI